MNTVYQNFDKAFSNVSAYVIMKDDKHVCNITFKHPKDGAGRLQCFIHAISSQMQQVKIGGYGYDKVSHAVNSCAEKYKDYLNSLSFEDGQNISKDFLRLIDILSSDSTQSGWTDQLYKNGFEKINVI